MELLSIIQEVLAEKRGPEESIYLEADGMFDQPDFESKVAWVKTNKPEIEDPDAYVAAALRKAGEIEEISTAGGAGASIEGHAGNIDRDKFVEELKLREFLRRAIKVVHNKQKENFLKKA